MNKKGILLFLLAVVCTITVSAQSHKGLRINEVMVQNNNCLVDEYGMHSAWIELYNTTRRTMNVSSVYITTERVAEGQTPDRNKMYLVPRGDHKTKVGHLQPVVFFADGEPGKGTLHTCITLVPGQENYIAVYDSDGLSKLDEVIIPANLPAGQSFARTTKIEDMHLIASADFNPAEWQICDGSAGKEITPCENNYVIGANQKIRQFKENDPNGFILTIMAMAIVFSALLLLSICFYVFGSISKSLSNKNKAKAEEKVEEVEEETEATVAQTPADVNGEVAAAIAMALYQHLNAHDEESNILTIKPHHSDWSSKIATLTELSSRR